MTYLISDLNEIIPIETGRTNTSYVLDLNGSKSILRISKEESQRHVIDRAFEQEVFARAAKADLAPAVIAMGKNFILTEYFNNQNKRDAISSIQMIVPALLELHNLIRGSSNAPIFEDVLRERISLVREATKNVPAKYWMLEEAALTIISSPEYLSLSRSLCHLDLTPRNILFGTNEIKFIDFEMASWGPKMLDFASLSVGYELDDDEEKEFLNLYFDENQATNNAYYTAKFCYHFRCVLWLLIQQQIETNNNLQEADMEDLEVDIEKSLICLGKISSIGRSHDHSLLSGPGNSGS